MGLEMGLFSTFLQAKTFWSFPDQTLDEFFSGIDFLVLPIGGYPAVVPNLHSHFEFITDTSTALS